MKTLTTYTGKRNQGFAGKCFLAVMVAFTLFACQKDVVNPTANTTPVVAAAPLAIGALKINETNITLLQGNENQRALTLRWEPAPGVLGATYTVEAALEGTDFTGFTEIGTTTQNGIDLTVKEANRQICKLVPAGTTATVNLRVRANRGAETPVYTGAGAVKITTYLNFIEYGATQLMHIPGNFENWDVAAAPHIVTPDNNGEFEGFVQFTNPFTQFLMVKAEKWDDLKTYYNIGAGKFGFGGNIFNINNGAGIYQIKANTNNNTWACTKINTMGIYGTATGTNGTDAEMTFNAQEQTWTINLELGKGNFRIRANNANTINFGKTWVNGYMVPDAKGDNFQIETPGFYTITLNLRLAGNYACTVAKTINNAN